MATAAVLLVVWALWRFRKWWGARRLKRRFRRARKGEVRAERVLRRANLEPLEEQVCREWSVWVNGEEEVIRLYADWIVEDGDQRYVVEVKTGRQAPSIRNASTRRQLLEYRCAFEVDGVILLDMESEEILVVEFPTFGDADR